eukprot:jgi/Bigna1/137504/aug1.39_g12212
MALSMMDVAKGGGRPIRLGVALPFEASPQDWELFLLIDTRELRWRRSNDFIPEKLKSLGVTVEVRALPLGDALWIARKRGGWRLQMEHSAKRWFWAYHGEENAQRP